MAAATLTKNCLRRTQHNHHSLNSLWTKSIKHSIPDPVAHQFNQIKHSSRFTHTRSQKPKYIEFSSPSMITTSHFSTRASSSSEKSGLVGWYLNKVKTRPISTKSITAAFIYAAADVSSQTIVGEASEKYDWTRILRMAGYGLLILGPSVHYWYNFMSRLWPKRDLVSTLKKMVLGQATFGPANTAVFFSVNAALQGESGSEIVGRLKRDLLTTIINGIMYWPLCDFVTFRFIPVYLQPLVTNSFSYLWTVYMTYMASLAKVDST